MSQGAVIHWGAAEAAALLRVPGPESHKYSRGVLGLRTGSSAYPGAAVLGAEAAWCTGVGLVRYVPALGEPAPEHGLPSPAAAILARRPETVFSADRAEDRARCDAWLIGSGTDPATRGFAEREALLELLAGDAPVVVDAGALGLVAERRPRAPVIVTPHLGEFRTLWRSAGLGEPPEPERPTGPPDPSTADAEGDEDPRGPSLAREALRLAERLGATVLLKGSRTIVAAPAGGAYWSGPATPWLATAGTGDVLAGALGALVATHSELIHEDPELLARLGATAAVLHDAAARIAAGERDEHAGAHDGETGPHREGGPVAALEVASAMGSAFRLVRG